MSVLYNEGFKGYRTANELLTAKPFLSGRDGVYMLCPDGTIGSATPVYCDMTTDGGGWMLIARSHNMKDTNITPNGNDFLPGTWGWLGTGTGSVYDYSRPYQLPWFTKWHSTGNTFSAFIFGNRLNINNSKWGPFIFKQTLPSYSTLMPSSGLNYNGTRTVLKSDFTVYNPGTGNEYPAMNQMYGYPAEGTNINMFFLRDCCGFSINGAFPNGMNAYYVDGPTTYIYSGPWGAVKGPALSALYSGLADQDGNFYQKTGSTNYGGTNQYMIMVK